MNTTDTLGFLLGRWAIERSIADHLSGTQGVFVGSASFVEAADGRGPMLRGGARYDETGELRFGAHIGLACRSLGCARLDGTTVQLYFSDGRPFTDLDLGSGAWRSTHHCGHDRYELTTLVRSHDELHERWRVLGPGKDYEATATLRRAG